MLRIMRGDWTRKTAFALLAAALGLLCGCNSTKAPGTDSLAAIHVKGRTPLEVARVLSEVFQSAGYQPTALPPSRGFRLQFERQGSLGATVMYGDWSSKDVWYRAKIKINRLETDTDTESDTYVVTCDAFRVLHRGDPHFEEEHRLTSMKSGPYQDLLDKAKARLEKSSS
jgi:hypothetical protein